MTRSYEGTGRRLGHERDCAWANSIATSSFTIQRRLRRACDTHPDARAFGESTNRQQELGA